SIKSRLLLIGSFEHHRYTGKSEQRVDTASIQLRLGCRIELSFNNRSRPVIDYTSNSTARPFLRHGNLSECSERERDQNNKSSLHKQLILAECHADEHINGVQI